MTKHIVNVSIHFLEDDATEKVAYTKDYWHSDAQKVKDMIGKTIDVVFCGSDYDEMLIEDDELESLNAEQQSFIAKRANELIKKYPEKADLFERYIKSQLAECDELENEIAGVTMLLQVL